MKKFWKMALVLCLCGLMIFTATACKKEVPEGLWQEATYQKDKEFGDGAKTLKVTVGAGGKAVVFTIHSDEEMVGGALLEHKLIEGDQGEFGMYIKKVNGIRADYDLDKAYWSFNQNGKYMMTGVDQTKFADGDQYELVYTKE